MRTTVIRSLLATAVIASASGFLCADAAADAPIGVLVLREHGVGSAAQAQPYVDKFVWAYIDTDEDSNAPDAEKYGVSGIPHIQFLDKEGKPVDKQVGSSSPDEFANTLKGVLAKAGG